jgi:hypothetical protein
MTQSTTAGISIKDKIDAGNADVLRRLTEVETTWLGTGVARDVVPGMHDNLILHSGPPISWDRMAPAQRQSVLGAVLFEGLADSLQTAQSLVESGGIELAPCHEFSTVGAMTGATSASMAMLIVENDETGDRAYCKVVERELQFGLIDQSVFDNLVWLRETLSPALDAAVKKLGGVKLISHTARALHMGDECHNRNLAATATLVRDIGPSLATVTPTRDLPDVLDYFRRIDQAYLGLAMASAKALTIPASDVPYSTVVTTLARNGVDVGIKVAGLGKTWFTGPAQQIEGAFMPGYGPEDATADIGDSAAVETVGLGAMAMANALTAGAIAGGSAQQAIARNRDNMQIAVGRSKSFTIPILDFEGTPVGIDIRKVVASGIRPYVLTGIVGNHEPWGRIGAGVVSPPLEPFVDALREFDRRLSQ